VHLNNHRDPSHRTACQTPVIVLPRRQIFCIAVRKTRLESKGTTNNTIKIVSKNNNAVFSKVNA
jgi:hypothetical protein